VRIELVSKTVVSQTEPPRPSSHSLRPCGEVPAAGCPAMGLGKRRAVLDGLATMTILPAPHRRGRFLRIRSASTGSDEGLIPGAGNTGTRSNQRLPLRSSDLEQDMIVSRLLDKDVASPDSCRRQVAVVR
jgi:hypothetical protein